MCFEHDSVPPVPRIVGAAVAHEDLELEAADGNRFAAFAALPDGPRGIGVAVLPDVRGLYRFYEELALRLAERGYAAVAIDYFGRTAGIDKRGEDFPFMGHVEQTTFSGVQSDVRAAVEWLRSARGGSCRSVFTLGFCFGGRHSWLAAAEGDGLAGAIGFYGRPGDFQDGTPGPTRRAADLSAPILALMGGDDPGIPAADIEAFEAALDEANATSDVVTYPGAPHSFFDRRYEQFASESDDAWARVIEFLERYGT
jgi:carboxymethylenebutenolidase